jgi:heptosyltransferase I
MMNDEGQVIHPSSLIPHPSRLLVVRLSALGDVIHTLPAVMSLRDSYDVSWVVEAPYADLVETVAGVRAIPVRLKRWSPAAILGAGRSVRGFEVAIDFQGLIKSALLARASGAPLRYGFHRELVREKPAALFYNHRIRVDRTKHVVDWNNELAAAVVEDRRPRLSSTQPNWKDFATDAQQRLGRFTNKIVLLPGAGRLEKLWPLERFREIAKRYGDRAVVVWGPGELDLAHAIGGTMAPATNLRELAFVLKQASVVVGGDTGPLHLADALGTRVVGLYGPTDPRRNGPYGLLSRTIRGSGSMDSITATEVANRIDEVLL